MKELGVLAYVLGDYLPSERLIGLLPNMPRHDAARLGFLLCDCECDVAKKIVNGLKCSNRQRKLALSVAKNAYRGVLEPRDVSKLCAELGESAKYVVCASILLGVSDKQALAWLENDTAPHSLSELAIGGGELVNIGFAGRDIGSTLAYLLDRATDAPELNTRETLLELAKEKYREGE